MTVFRRLTFVVALGIGVGGLALPTATHAEDGQTYLVAEGDTLIGIASKSGIRLSELLRSNNLRLTSLIMPGQQLDIPSSTGAPASSTSTPTSSSTVQVGGTYEVRWGDTLSGIARRHRVSLASFMKVNQMSITSLIMPGMQLSLPNGVTSTSPSPSPSPAATSPKPSSHSSATHTVRAGDTLSGIASRYRVSLASFIKVNQMSTTSLILPGMQLSLPSGATETSAVGPSEPTSRQPATSSATGAAAVVNYALAQVGKPYRFFSKGPDAFDCSGLSLAAYRQVGVKLVHYSAWQARQGTSVDFRNEPIQPGDLVFQARRGSDTINHVGIAVTSTTWIQAVGTGIPVRVGPMPAMSTIAVVRRYVDSA